MNHLQDHLLVWYEEMMKLDAAKQMGKEPDDVDWDNDPNSSIELAKSAPVVDNAANMAFAKIPQLIQMAMQLLQQNAPKPPQDPMVGVAMQEVQGKMEIAKGQLSLDQQKAAAEAENKRALAQQKAREAEIEYDIEMKRIGITAHTDMAKAELQSKTDLAKTVHANTSDQHIATHRTVADTHAKIIDSVLNQNSKGE